jgi:predicted lipid-binding transport protein (Tim44 family)
MKKTSKFWLNAFIAFCLLTAWVGESNAARLGGGRSFGSRPSYSAPYNRSGGFNQASPAQQPAYQQPSMAAQRNQTARDAMGRRGGMMGMLGGLALGGLLGALFFGGAFEGINFMDILLFAGVAFVLYKLFAAYSQRGLGQAASGTQSYGQPGESGFDHAYQRNAEPNANRPSAGPGFDTDLLSKRAAISSATGFKPSSPLNWPADFDAAAFLKGAKTAYAHLQQAWDNADLAELRGLCNDTVFSELQTQLKQRVGENRTELLKVEAQILQVDDVGGDRVASVLFNVVLREVPGQAPTAVKEVWHFTRPLSSKQPTWYLDGIQQLED